MSKAKLEQTEQNNQTIMSEMLPGQIAVVLSSAEDSKNRGCIVAMYGNYNGFLILGDSYKPENNEPLKCNSFGPKCPLEVRILKAGEKIIVQ